MRLHANSVRASCRPPLYAAVALEFLAEVESLQFDGMLFLVLNLLSCVGRSDNTGRKKREKMVKKTIFSTKVKILSTKMELSKSRAQIREMKEELEEININMTLKKAEIESLKNQKEKSVNSFIAIKRESYNYRKIKSVSRQRAGKIEAKDKRILYLTSKLCALAAKLPAGETQQVDDVDDSEIVVPTPSIFYPQRGWEAVPCSNEVVTDERVCEEESTEQNAADNNTAISGWVIPTIQVREIDDLSIGTITSDNSIASIIK